MSISDRRQDTLPRMLRFTTTELREFEDLLVAALIAADVDALDELYAKDATLVGPDGSRFTRDDEIDARRSGSVAITSYDVEEFDARVYGDTGITTSLATLRGTAGGSSFELHLRYTRTWIGLPSSWRVVASHATNVD